MHSIKSYPLTALALLGALPLSWSGAQATQVQLGAKPPLRIAIIGAGAGGSSAAFWIQKAKERHGMDVQVDVFERLTRVGGRATTVHPYDDTSLPPQELGASIFVPENKNLFRAAREFGLDLVDLFDEDDITLWDGDQVLLSYTGGWWDNLKILWRYGYRSPSRSQTLTQQMIDRVLTMYTPTLPRWTSIQGLVKDLGFTNYTAQSGLDVFTSHGVSQKFAEEMIEAATRVNYAQDITTIHGVGAGVSMVASGAAQVSGGNYRIFEEFIKRSGAKLHLNTTVSGLQKTISASTGRQAWTLSGGSHIPSTAYDHVILAAPFAFSGITLEDSTALLPKVEYVRLHVTLVSTTSPTARPERFGLQPGTHVGKFILTTKNRRDTGSSSSVCDTPTSDPAVGPGCKQNLESKPDFNSISLHQTFERNGRKEYIWKVFSMDRKNDEWLEDVFGEGTVGWTYRKVWYSYPILHPAKAFPPLKADEGLWYVNSMEPFISTMETETLSSRNIVDNLLQESFGHGICPSSSSPDGWGYTIEDEKIYGWDC
ncbi:hypothetical protein FS837_009184 [Tulasnella sp. UAMH 9824]|nr:hypothetical protein FS837_009184 [Tulasnella sp. UAMH 9824]